MRADRERAKVENQARADEWAAVREARLARMSEAERIAEEMMTTDERGWTLARMVETWPQHFKAFDDGKVLHRFSVDKDKVRTGDEDTILLRSMSDTGRDAMRIVFEWKMDSLLTVSEYRNQKSPAWCDWKRYAILFIKVDGSEVPCDLGVATAEEVAEMGELLQFPGSTSVGSSGLAVVCLGDVEAKRVDWLWRPRIARGKLTIIAGMPDVNKSTVVLDIAARVTVGGALPAGEGQVPLGSVILLTAEDDLADTVKPRFEVAGGDPERVKVIKMVEAQKAALPGRKGRPRSFNLVQDIDRLEMLIQEIGDVMLVIIDPVSAYMGKPGELDSHRNSDIRGVMMPLHEMAARRGVAIVGIDHLNKGGGNQAMLRVVGSIAFVGAPRSVYLVVRDEEDEDRRLFLPVKNNIAKVRTGLAFRVVDKLAPAPVFEAYPAVAWEDKAVTMTADEALDIKSDGRKSEKMEAAESLILEMLKDGARPQSEIEERAIKQGINNKSLWNAKKAVFAKSSQAGRVWWWCLPGQKPPM
jgi:putative DNA primase/helicase